MRSDLQEGSGTVLFVCVHNAARSQMAEALFNIEAARQGLTYRAVSAGTIGGSDIAPSVVTVMEEIGVSMVGHFPKQLTELMVRSATRVISMGCGVDERACPARMTISEDWNLEDPKGQPLDKVCEIRDEIQARVRKLIEELSE